jgi:hypothetical protein
MLLNNNIKMSIVSSSESYLYPTEYITENNNKKNVYVDIDQSMMRVRSHKFPDSDDDNQYIDTTYYDEKNETLDLGFQRLRHLHMKFYPEFAYLRKLYVDHNNLRYLPDAKYLPNLEQLTCSSNLLSDIPYYPYITFLNISNNNITNCRQYHKSNIEYFDCSHNKGFKCDFSLPNCKHLYINDTDLTYVNLELFSKLQFLDCSSNQIDQINGNHSLLELSIQNNNITEIPDFPNLKRLMADNNKIKILNTYLKLVCVNISFNNLVEIKKQPILKKLIANNNKIYKLDHMPKLELIDLSYNNITYFDVPDCAEYISLHFNPITSISLGSNALTSLKELQVNFETYKYIYEKYYQNFDAVNIQINDFKLSYYLKKINRLFDNQISAYIFKQFNRIIFRDRESTLFRISLKLYYDYFSLKGVKNMEEITNSEEFKHLFNSIEKIYYKTIVITLYFNGYHN